MIDAGLCRNEVNRRVRIIRRAFKWAASEEMISVSIYQALATVEGLRKGRTEAPDHPPVAAVADEVVNATLPHLPQVVADMVSFQRATGARPGEACSIRPGDVDRSDDVWVYRPASHKTEHFDRPQVIFLGPKAQEILKPYLLRPSDQHCFSPAESEKKAFRGEPRKPKGRHCLAAIVRERIANAGLNVNLEDPLRQERIRKCGSSRDPES